LEDYRGGGWRPRLVTPIFLPLKRSPAGRASDGPAEVSGRLADDGVAEAQEVEEREGSQPR
jgi:hypothetical protein